MEHKSLLSSIKSFSLKSLKQTSTRVRRADGTVTFENGGSDECAAAFASKGDFFVVDTSDDHEPCRVVDGLYIGSMDAASRQDELTKCSVTHVVNCAATICPCPFE